MEKKKISLRQELNMDLAIPGAIVAVLLIVVAAFFPDALNNSMNAALNWIMGGFKWVFVLVTVACIAVCVWLMCSKYGNIRIGGNEAKPRIKTGTWFALSLTSGIAVGICFFGVTGPLGFFLEPPAFLGIEGGTPEAVIPAFTYTFLHWTIGPFALLCFAGLALAYIHFNMKRPYRPSSMLYPILGEKTKTWGRVVDLAVFLMLVISATNMGLASIQLNAGLQSVFGLVGNFVNIIILFYAVVTFFCTATGVNGWMGRISNFNVAMYVFFLVFVLCVGPTSRLVGTCLTAIGEFIAEFIPMTFFTDPVLQTGWQENWQTMFYYSWNIAPSLASALFYGTMAYGRTIKEFIMVHMIVPTGLYFLWYSVFGGTAIYQVLDGDMTLATIMAEQGGPATTFAFMKTLPIGGILCILYLITAMVTYITNGNGTAYSFPLLLTSKEDMVETGERTPRKSLIAVICAMQGIITFILINIGGYDALSSATIVVAFPIAIILLLIVIGMIRAVLNRDKYDVFYQEEIAKTKG